MCLWQQRSHKQKGRYHLVSGKFSLRSIVVLSPARLRERCDISIANPANSIFFIFHCSFNDSPNKS